ncbi:hypothetical protein QS460_03785 [Liquorilactobacillus mali]|uniref:hypothetical protein n=1 Tax=Liquorilactobacillus mali TaxID=1618 RepID=UPI00264C28C9|nr:hypothetical protein [Liquorilactobacillus mali]MDN7145046.1 hypothetical protein [Liquorilactobacillus mali]
MSREYEKPTEVFKPHNSADVEPTESATTLSTSGRLISYNNELKNSLENGYNFTKLLDQLITTTNTDELFEAAQALSTYQLDTAYLTFPQQYSQSDFYLIFINRLLALHDRERVILQSSDRYSELYHEFPGINSAGYFVFKLENTVQGGAYYTEKTTGEALFYLNFEKHVLRFNSRAVTQLLLVEYHEKISQDSIKGFENYLLNIGNFLKEDYGFDVDFTLLDPSNSAVYQLADPNLPSSIIDRLFVEAANGGRMLELGENSSPILRLDNGTVIELFEQHNYEDDVDLGWGIKVYDQQHKIAWFDVLLSYEFLRSWYLENLNTLEIQSDALYFN